MRIRLDMKDPEKEFTLRNRVVLPLYIEEGIRVGIENITPDRAGLILTKNDIKRCYERWKREGCPNPKNYNRTLQEIADRQKDSERALTDKINTTYATILKDMKFMQRLKYLFTKRIKV